jgi:ankyrin repeat protein
MGSLRQIKAGRRLDEMLIDRSLLMKAIEEEDVRTVNSFVASGFDLNFQHNNGDSPLTKSIKSLQKFSFGKNKEIFDSLLKGNIDFNYSFNGTFNLPLTKSLYTLNDWIIERILNSRVEVNYTFEDTNDRGIWTPLTWIISNFGGSGVIDLIKTVLDLGADPNTKVHEGLTAVLMAVKRGNVPIIDVLKQYGARINEVTDNEQNALHLLCKESVNNLLMDYNLINTLITVDGININAKDKFGRTPISYVRKDTRLFAKLSTYVKNIPKDIHTLYLAIKMSDTSLVRSLLETQSFSKSDLNEKVEGQYLLEIALKTAAQSLDIIKYLVKHGANPNVKNDKGKLIDNFLEISDYLPDDLVKQVQNALKGT